MKTFSNEVKQLASILHLRCNGNHVDYCGWFYGDAQRQHNYEEAEKILGKMKKFRISLVQFREIMLILYPGREDWLNR